jgi:hypothetical protein
MMTTIYIEIALDIEVLLTSEITLTLFYGARVPTPKKQSLTHKFSQHTNFHPDNVNKQTSHKDHAKVTPWREQL